MPFTFYYCWRRCVLQALGNVICALSEGKQHVPYRDSKLTRMLQVRSLLGSSRVRAHLASQYLVAVLVHRE